MKHLLTLATMVLVAQARAQTSPPNYATVEPLLTRNGCTTCHAPAKKVIGPSFRDVARKYDRVADANGVLATKIRGGSSGAWGTVPMPPNPLVSDEDLRVIAQWIAGGATPPD